MKNGIIFDIKKYAIHDGPGIRTTFFFKGCPLRCPWCHNPEGMRKKPETVRITHALEIGRTEPRTETIGRPVTVLELLEEALRDVPFYDESGGGVTLSGGEPLMQPSFVFSFLEELKAKEIHTALDTTGYTSPGIIRRILPLADLLLLDIKIANPRRHKAVVGVSLSPVLRTLKIAIEAKTPIRLRFPVIPGFTDDAENLEGVATMAAAIPTLAGVDILPYHDTAAGKRARLFRRTAVPAPRIIPPGEASLQAARTAFEAAGLSSHVGE